MFSHTYIHYCTIVMHKVDVVYPKAHVNLITSLITPLPILLLDFITHRFKKLFLTPIYMSELFHHPPYIKHKQI